MSPRPRVIHNLSLTYDPFLIPPPSFTKVRPTIQSTPPKAAQMPALYADGEENGSVGSIRPHLIVVIVCLLAFGIIAVASMCYFGRNSWLGKIWMCRRKAAQPSPTLIAVAGRSGGVTYPASTPRKWKSWRRATDNVPTHSGYHRFGSESPSLTDSSLPSRTASNLSPGTPDVAYPVPIVAAPPRVRLGQPLRVAGPPS
ncbi:hypothetical protein BC628DRAFT_1420404 [Trametes gibbosa]|nr:hypothetical protein BC628DRAFT_1420404 [Trametes gibbosa]